MASIERAWTGRVPRVGVRAWTAVRWPPWALDGGTSWLAGRAGLAAAVLFASVLGATWSHTPSVHFNRWDTDWYVRIAAYGYNTEQSANFFPLLPALMGGLARFATGHPIPTSHELLPFGFAIANAAALVALCGLAALVGREDGAKVGGTTVRLLAAYPFAFFLAAVYTEPLFLACAVLTFLAARSGRWWLVAPAGVAAGLLRPTAPLLVLPLAWEAVRQLRGRRPAPAEVAARAVAIAAPVAGVAVYSVFLWRRFGDPLLFLHTQQVYWLHEFWPVWKTLAMTAERALHGNGLAAMDLTVALVFLGLTVAIVGRLPFAYLLYQAPLVLAVLSSPVPAWADPIASTGRYMLAAFPAFWLVARWVTPRPRVEQVLLAGGYMLQSALAIAFLLGGPVF